MGTEQDIQTKAVFISLAWKDITDMENNGVVV